MRTRTACTLFAPCLSGSQFWQPGFVGGFATGRDMCEPGGAIRVGNLKRLKHHGNPLLGLSDTCALYWNNCLYESKMFPSQKSTNMMENIAQSGRMLR